MGCGGSKNTAAQPVTSTQFDSPVKDPVKPQEKQSASPPKPAQPAPAVQPKPTAPPLGSLDNKAEPSPPVSVQKAT
eukprot:746210-Hanusia_phi.AAC.1